MKVLFVASEVEGLAKTGGLADVAKSLPKALVTEGNQVRVVLPFYRTVREQVDAPVILESELTIGNGQSIGYGVREIELSGVTVWAIDCFQLFDRAQLYAENNVAYSDNGERFAFLSAASLDLAEKLGFQPNIVHCNDWHTGLVPFLLKTRYGNDDFFKYTRSVLTIHNAVFKGEFNYHDVKVIPEILRHRYPDIEADSHHVSYLKAGVLYADKINAVSPNYAHELLSDMGSQGMGAEFSSRLPDLVGIVNGCDYQDWNPETDTLIPQRYKANKTSFVRGKRACKKALQERLGLTDENVPMFGMVCRLTDQKGLQYLIPILSQFLVNDVQLVIVGTGDPGLAGSLRQIAEMYKTKFAFVEKYDNEIAHWVEASSDFFLMPSQFEPCGLNQMYSMAYGTLPIVRNVGGLKDTVLDYDENAQFATGFTFSAPEPLALLAVMQRALLLYCQKPEEFRRVQLNAMACRFDWSESAQQYLDLYLAALAGVPEELLVD